MVAPLIRVKFLSKAHPYGASAEQWLRRFPGGHPVIGSCRFTFDHDDRDYDWVVVYDDLPRTPNSQEGWCESLACSPDNTLLVTTEPASIKAYGRAYVRQFGHVLSSQESWALHHPRIIRRQPGLICFYGMESPHGTHDAMASAVPGAKAQLIATVCSSKRMGHTLHAARYDFTQKLKERLPELEVFGHGVRPIHDKSESVDPFRYHISVENHLAPHHWTEKLADAFLGFSLPFYFGCPNVAEYFPPDSYIPIDIFDPAGAERIIRDAIESDEYSRRLPAIVEARRLVLEKYGTFQQLSALIAERHQSTVTAIAGARPANLRSRHSIRRSSPVSALLDLTDKIRNRLRPIQRSVTMSR